MYRWALIGILSGFLSLLLAIIIGYGLHFLLNIVDFIPLCILPALYVLYCYFKGQGYITVGEGTVCIVAAGVTFWAGSWLCIYYFYPVMIIFDSLQVTNPIPYIKASVYALSLSICSGLFLFTKNKRIL